MAECSSAFVDQVNMISIPQYQYNNLVCESLYFRLLRDAMLSSADLSYDEQSLCFNVYEVDLFLRMLVPKMYEEKLKSLVGKAHAEQKKAERKGKNADQV